MTNDRRVSRADYLREPLPATTRARPGRRKRAEPRGAEPPGAEPGARQNALPPGKVGSARARSSSLVGQTGEHAAASLSSPQDAAEACGAEGARTGRPRPLSVVGEEEERAASDLASADLNIRIRVGCEEEEEGAAVAAVPEPSPSPQARFRRVTAV